MDAPIRQRRNWTFIIPALWRLLWKSPFQPSPYKTANTLNYTNVGTMLGSGGLGIRFRARRQRRSRSMSASFFNDSRGHIQAVDGAIFNPGDSHYSYLASYLLISATNVVNKGTLVGWRRRRDRVDGVECQSRPQHAGDRRHYAAGQRHTPTNFFPGHGHL